MGLARASRVTSPRTWEGEERLWLGLACALVLLDAIETANPESLSPGRIFAGVGATIALGFLARGKARALPVLVFVALAGIALRLEAVVLNGSDVWRATAEALDVISRGWNPYTHVYATTSPPGAPFVYLPGEIALYAIQSALTGGLQDHDRWWGILTLLALALSGTVFGYARAAVATALFGMWPMAILRSIDGANDSGLAFLVVTALVLLAFAIREESRRVRVATVLYALSAGAFGWGLAFKLLSWPLFPFVVRFIGSIDKRRRVLYLCLALGTAVGFCLPYAIAAPLPFVSAIGQSFAYHHNIWGFDVWSGLLQIKPAWIPADTRWYFLAAIAFAFAFMWGRSAPPTLGHAVLQGTVVVLVALLMAGWSSTAYYVFAVALIAVALAAFRPLPSPTAVQTLSDR
ncbi:MAG: hypothetical protein JOY59_11200 [Candidatus Eremiobacteraeota bacterium]|nr:hypothetical protein [Candidatus Eremiobacteraeota bacterium]